MLLMEKELVMVNGKMENYSASNFSSQSLLVLFSIHFFCPSTVFSLMSSFSSCERARLSFFKELARLRGESSSLVTSFVFGSIPRAVLAVILSCYVNIYSLVFGYSLVKTLGLTLCGFWGLPDNDGSFFSSYLFVDSCSKIESTFLF